jgi:hypothetical protein
MRTKYFGIKINITVPFCGMEVGIAVGYGLNYRGFAVRVPVGSNIFMPTYYLVETWDVPSLLCSD